MPFTTLSTNSVEVKVKGEYIKEMSWVCCGV